MKYIREGRFGPPKCWKTGSVVGTYPRPLLVFSFEVGGLEIIREPVVLVPASQLGGLVKTPPPISALDFTFTGKVPMEVAYTPAKDRTPFDELVQVINYLISLGHAIPFKTVVLDTVTGLSDAIYSHQALSNSSALADARKWAGNIGMKTKQTIDYMNQFQCNTVCIFHTEVSTDEEAKRVAEQPMVYSKIRNFVGAMFSQFFYQQIHAGRPVLRVRPFDLVQGIGCRWPDFTGRDLIGPTFKEIYGQEKDVYQ